MSDWPASLPLSDAPVIVSPLSSLSIGSQAGGSLGFGSAAWPTANLAIFTPVRLSSVRRFKMLGVVNGTAVSGNIDVGIYAKDGTRLVSSGSTAHAGTSVVQTFDIPDIDIGPGVFYLAVALSNNTGHTNRLNPGFVFIRILGSAQMASAFPLPATATFAAMTNNYMPLVAATTRTFI